MATSDLLNDIRALLLEFESVTNLVGQRIRPHEPDSDDGDSDVILLDLPDSNEDNLLSSQTIINAELVIRTRSTDKTQATVIANAVREAIHGYSGDAGNGNLIECLRTEFSESEFDDEDDDDDGYFETESLYPVWYQTS